MSPHTSQLWGRFLKYFLIAVALACVVGLWCFFQAARTAIDAEYTLHAYYAILELVEQHVSETGQWPSDWKSLEKIPYRHESMWKWPEDSTEIQRRITIDFELSLDQVAAMTPEDFPAIRQRQPCFPMTGRVEILLEAIRGRLGEAKSEP